ncbi:MAG: HEAT repeat domain-containing protein [Clostridiales bacterium]
MAFWKKIWGKDEKAEDSAQEWQEIILEDEVKTTSKKTMDKRILEACSGRMNPLEAQGVLAEYTKNGWENIEAQVKDMAMGKIYATPWALGEIFHQYPQESASLLFNKVEDLPIKNGLMLLSITGKGREDEVIHLVSEKINALDEDDLSTALRILAKYPTTKAKELLASYLSHENWKIVMKAAVGLSEIPAKEYLPQMKVAAAKGGILGAGLQDIIKRME